jgi:hypothetical protein
MKDKGSKRLRGPSVRRYRQLSGRWPVGYGTDESIADEGRACLHCQAPMAEQQVLHLARTVGVLWIRITRCTVCEERVHTPLPPTKSAEMFTGMVRDEAA